MYGPQAGHMTTLGVPTTEESKTESMALPARTQHLKWRRDPYAPGEDGWYWVGTRGCPGSEPGSCCTETSIYLVGTCHVSKQSVLDVQTAIRIIKPQVRAHTYLCHARCMH